jgi:hypothetical protein
LRQQIEIERLNKENKERDERDKERDKRDKEREEREEAMKEKMREMEEEIRLMKERERKNNPNPQNQTQTLEKPGWVVDGRSKEKNVRKTYSCTKCLAKGVRSDKRSTHRCSAINGG